MMVPSPLRERVRVRAVRDAGVSWRDQRALTPGPSPERERQE